MSRLNTKISKIIATFSKTYEDGQRLWPDCHDKDCGLSIMALTSGTSQRTYGPRGTIIKLMILMTSGSLYSPLRPALILGEQCLML